MEALKNALSFLAANPLLALGVGLTMVAVGTALKNKLNKNKSNQGVKLAKGGLAYGPTSAIVGDNPNAGSDPEVIAPLSKLKGMIGGPNVNLSLGGSFRIHGRDLVYVLKKEDVKLSTIG